MTKDQMAPAVNEWSERPEKNNVRVVEHLRSSPLFVEFREAFEAATGLPLILRPPGAFQSPLDGSKRRNPFCARMAQHNKSCSACLQFQAKVEADASMATKTFSCYAGLVESAVPVRVGVTLIGYLQTGQVFLERPEYKTFADTIGRIRTGDGEEKIRELATVYERTQLVSKARYEAYLGLLAFFAQHLSTMSNEVLVRATGGEMPAIMRARAFVLAHAREDIRLCDAARAANVSAHYFCKIFRRVTGFTFTTYLARVRVGLVKQELLSPHVRVCESAYAAGFKSLSQFNRVFRHVAGEPPTQFRARLLNHTPRLQLSKKPNGKTVQKKLRAPVGPGRKGRGGETGATPPVIAAPRNAAIEAA